MTAHTRPRMAAARRETAGRKSELHALRRAGEVPGSLYGHGDPELVRVSQKEIGEYLRHHGLGGLLDLEVDGQTAPALIRELDRDPISSRVISIGFQRVDLRETLHATLPLQFVGEEELVREGLVLQLQMTDLDVTGRADLLPEAIIVELHGRGAGQTIRVGDLALPEGLHTAKDPDQPVATISLPTVPADVEAALEAEEAAHAALHAENEAAAAEEGEGAGEPEAEPAANP